MWIDRLLQSPTRQALEWTARFAEERHQVLAENVANIDTPGYPTRQLDPREFQAALNDALKATRPGAPAAPLHSRQVSTDGDGKLTARPKTEPAENVLFHDGTNARLEGLMTDVQDNAMSYELAINMLKTRFNTLLTAIKGRNT